MDKRPGFKGKLEARFTGLAINSIDGSKSKGSILRIQDRSLELESAKLSSLYHDPIEGKYELQEILGEGCAAVVRKCTNKETSKTFAIKIMRTDDVEKVQVGKNEF